MFKKFVDFFFEDVDEEQVVEEVAEESVAPVKTSTSVQESAVKKSMTDISLEPQPKMEAPAPSVTTSNKMEFYEVAQKPSRFIDLEEVKKEIRPARRERRVEIKDLRKTDYEFNAVISPIFGVKESANSSHSDKTDSPKKDAEESILGTVFSPMYGRGNGRSEEVKETTKQEPSVAIKVEENLPPMFELDDILANSNKLERSEDTHQFSIFDDFQQENNESIDLESELSEYFDFDNK